MRCRVLDDGGHGELVPRVAYACVGGSDAVIGILSGVKNV